MPNQKPANPAKPANESGSRRRRRRPRGGQGGRAQNDREAAAPQPQASQSAAPAGRALPAPAAAAAAATAPNRLRRPGRRLKTAPGSPRRSRPKAAPAPRPPKRPAPPAAAANRAARPGRRTPGLLLITRSPPKQKFASFEEYIAAHGGVTAPVEGEADAQPDGPPRRTGRSREPRLCGRAALPGVPWAAGCLWPRAALPQKPQL